MTSENFFDNLIAEIQNRREAAGERANQEAGVRDDSGTGRPIRYSYNGRVEEPNGTTDAFMVPMQRMIQDIEAAEKNAVAEFARMMQELSPYDERLPEDCPIKVRGFLFWKNSEDLERVNAYKANKDRGILNAELMKSMAQLVDYAHYLATESNERMWVRNQQRPAELQHFGEFIRLLGGAAMGNMIKEMLIMHPDMGMRLIAQTTYKKQK
jgi:hypothetical protein